MNSPFVFGKSNSTPQIVDNRKRCTTCDMLEPQHRKWCITPAARGEETMETREIKGQQSLTLADEATSS